MRFGLFIPQGWRMDLVGIDPADQWATMNGLVTRADAGETFESVWVYDHFHTVPEPTKEATHEAWTLMAAFAATTSRIRLGQMCTCMAYRNPAYLAKVAATIDIISAGRIEMGIGAGWYEHEWRAYGYGFPGAGMRIGALDEGVQIMKQAWETGEATLDGTYFQVDGARVYPQPLQKPHIPLWIAGGGEKKTLRIVARVGDYANIDGSVEGFAPDVAAVPRQDRGLVREALNGPVDVGVVTHPGHDPQGLLLPAAGDPQRDVRLLQRLGVHPGAVHLEVRPVQGGLAGLPGLLHDLHALVQGADPHPGAGEAVAVGPPLVLVPAGADAHLDPAAADDVDGRGDLREVRGVAVGHAGAHLTEPDPRRRRREGGHQGPGLVRRLVGRLGHGVEVVVDPDRLEGCARVRPRDQPVHGGPLVSRVDADQVHPPALRNEESEAHAFSLRGVASIRRALSAIRSATTSTSGAFRNDTPACRDRNAPLQGGG